MPKAKIINTHLVCRQTLALAECWVRTFCQTPIDTPFWTVMYCCCRAVCCVFLFLAPFRKQTKYTPLSSGIGSSTMIHSTREWLRHRLHPPPTHTRLVQTFSSSNIYDIWCPPMNVESSMYVRTYVTNCLAAEVVNCRYSVDVFSLTALLMYWLTFSGGLFSQSADWLEWYIVGLFQAQFHGRRWNIEPCWWRRWDIRYITVYGW